MAVSAGREQISDHERYICIWICRGGGGGGVSCSACAVGHFFGDGIFYEVGVDVVCVDMSVGEIGWVFGWGEVNVAVGWVIIWSWELVVVGVWLLSTMVIGDNTTRPVHRVLCWR